MKKLIAIILSGVIISQTMVNVGIGIYYHLNKVYVVQKLCENRQNPQLHCNGHCYLSKQLKNAEEKESKSAKLIKEKEESVYNQFFSSFTGYLPDCLILKFYPGKSALYQFNTYHCLLKPPAG